MDHRGVMRALAPTADGPRDKCMSLREVRIYMRVRAKLDELRLLAEMKRLGVAVRGDRHAAWEIAISLNIVLDIIEPHADARYRMAELRSFVAEILANGDFTATVVKGILDDDADEDARYIRKQEWWVVLPTEETFLIYTSCLGEGERSRIYEQMIYCIEMAKHWQTSLFEGRMQKLAEIRQKKAEGIKRQMTEEAEEKMPCLS